MNISDTKTLHPCTSCQLCAGVCPNNAISIGLDEEGFYRPTVDPDKCIDCGLCQKVCYKFHNEAPDIATVDRSKHYAAYANDAAITAQSTSGGVASVLTRQLISQGYTCVGVAYDYSTDRAVGAIATDDSEAEAFKGSKYIQSLSVDAFRQLLHMNRQGRYAVFGTPCQIYAFDLLLKQQKRRDNFLLVDIYCHGCPTLNLWTKYARHIKQHTHNSSLKQLAFRSKARGWGRYCISTNNKGKLTYLSPKTNDAFYTLFFSNHVLNDACKDCTLRSTLSHSDIRLGDFWGKCYDLNTQGVSLVSVNTERGQELFNQIKPQLWYKEHAASDFMVYQSIGTSYIIDEQLRSKLLHMLATEDIPLKAVAKTYWHSLPPKKKARQLVKNIILHLPTGLVSLAKKIYH